MTILVEIDQGKGTEETEVMRGIEKETIEIEIETEIEIAMTAIPRGEKDQDQIQIHDHTITANIIHNHMAVLNKADTRKDLTKLMRSEQLRKQSKNLDWQSGTIQYNLMQSYLRC